MPWRKQLQHEHAIRKRDNLWRERSVVASPQGRIVVVDNQEYLNFCSNDYLGLANHAFLKSAVEQTVQSRGTGSGASHLICGHFDLHQQLELELAEFVDAEQAIVFSTGYMANLAIPQTFLGRGDLVLQDRSNHASLIDAGRYCDAKMKRYPHRDLDVVDQTLTHSAAKRKLVMTDGVFSMDGDIAPLVQLRDICRQRGAVLVVDDAHGFGVLGDRGMGSLEIAGIRPEKNVLLVGTFGKAAGSFGAFIAGDADYIQAIVQHGRTYIYTTALPASVIAATLAALKIFQREPERRVRLKRNIQQFRDSVSAIGLKLMDSQTPIQPIVFGAAAPALRASQLLKQNGIWVSAIRPPTVPAGLARLRVTLTAEHSAADIDKLTNVLGSAAMLRVVEETQ